MVKASFGRIATVDVDGIEEKVGQQSLGQGEPASHNNASYTLGIYSDAVTPQVVEGESTVQRHS
jgi:hypothetical protein